MTARDWFCVLAAANAVVAWAMWFAGGVRRWPIGAARGFILGTAVVQPPIAALTWLMSMGMP